LSLLLTFVFSVGGLVTALLAAAVWCWVRPRSTAARRFLLGAAVVYTLASIYAVPVAIARLLTAGYGRFDRNDLPGDRTALIVLDSGTELVQGWDEQFTPLNLSAAARVLEAWRVFNRLSPAWIISTHGVSSEHDAHQPRGVNMRDALVQLGVPATRIVVQTGGLNTHEEAVLVVPIVRALHMEHVVLVTSGVHMRRSIGAFRAQGMLAIPAIAPDPRSGRDWPQWIRPTREGLEYSSEVAHELAGIPYYWVRGWWRSS